MTKAILSSNQIHRLHHTFFIPKGAIKASLLIVHGMAEHSGRYAKFAEFLSDNGILVLTYDLLGHGKTVKDQYELGFFDEKYPVQTLCKDVVIMADALKNKAKSLTDRSIPHYIMGHSMGSFIVRVALTHHATSFAGAILMGTADTASITSQLAMPMLALLNRTHPKLANQKTAALMNHTLLSQLRSPISASPFAWLSENTDNIKAFENDPLCGFVFSNNGFYTVNRLMLTACQNHWFANLPNDFKILLISGKDDPVGNMGADITRLHDKLLAQTHAHITSRLYPNMRHEPLHERQSEQVFDDILSWLL